MPRSKDTKVWNEDLVTALQARADMARRQGKRSALTFQQAATVVQSTRGDIYQFKTQRIVNYPHTKLCTTMDQLCRQIIAGTAPILPPGYVGHGVHSHTNTNPYLQDPYLKTIKNRGGAFAILLAFHVSQNTVLTKEQLCTTGQTFCDEEMMENWHAGRARGAWAANKTLVKHGLILAHSSVGYSERAGGMRAKGPSTYTLTENGRLFIQALLETRPDVQRQIDLARGQAQQREPIGAARGTNTTAFPNIVNPYARQERDPIGGATTTQFPRIVNPYARSNTALRAEETAAIGATKTPPKPNKFYTSDEQELRNWLQTAAIGQQKEFRVGKDRRSYLHDVCTTLNATLVGRRLLHQSEGIGRSRFLLVTLAEDESTTLFTTPPRRNSVSHTTTPPSSTTTTSYISTPPRTLEDASPAKRRLVPARTAAAQAAYERFALAQTVTPPQPAATKPASPKQPKNARNLFILDCSSDDDDDEANKYFPQTTKERKLPPPPSATICLDDSSSSDDEDINTYPATARMDDRKKPAVPSVFSDDSSSDEDDLPPSVFGKKKDATQPQRANPPPRHTITHPRRKDPPPRVVVPKKEKQQADLPLVDRDSMGCYDKIIISIDCRERNRNATPRLMRMELNRLLSSGPLALVWSGLPRCVVEERQLQSGDFAVSTVQQQTERALPVLVERKRIGDLVQRSTKKDHWYQLQRMQLQADVSVLLLEGDPRTTSQFVPYGAQQQQEEAGYSPYHHTIEDEESLYLFFDKSHSTRFVQTKDEQSSLRMVGSIALMSLFATRPMELERRGDAKAERTILCERLQKGGIPFRLASRIADEVGSVARMQSLFDTAATECRPLLLVPMLQDLAQNGNPCGWSRAIHAVWHAKDSDKARAQFEQSRGLVDDHSLLLEKLHSGFDADAAVDFVLSTQQSTSGTRIGRRTVHISVPVNVGEVFENASEGQSAFYKVRLVDPIPNALPCIVMQTMDGRFASSKLHVFLMDGKDFILQIHNMLRDDTDCIRAAKRIAVAIKQSMPNAEHPVLLVRGFTTAMDQAAKKPDHIFETRVVVIQILGCIMEAGMKLIRYISNRRLMSKRNLGGTAIATNKRTENELVVLRFFRLVNEHNMRGAFDCFDPSASIDYDSLSICATELCNEMETLLRAFPGYIVKHSTAREVSTGCVIVEFVVASGTHTGGSYAFGPFPPVVASDKFVRNDRECYTFQLDERNRVTHCRVNCKDGILSGPGGFYEQVGGNAVAILISYLPVMVFRPIMYTST